MPSLDLTGVTTVEEWGPRLVAIPAGYAIGAWLGTLVAYVVGVEREARADWRDVVGIVGGVAGLVIWFIISFLLD
jgi:hypothetical protein